MPVPRHPTAIHRQTRRPSLRLLAALTPLAAALTVATGASAAEPLGDKFTASSGVVGQVGFSAQSESAYNDARNEYLVVWRRDVVDDVGPQIPGLIYAQRVSAAGTLLGAPIAVSDAAATGQPDVAYIPDGDAYLVVWGTTLAFPQGNESEIFSQRINGDGTKATVNVRISNAGNAGDTNWSTIGPSAVGDPASGEVRVAWTQSNFALTGAPGEGVHVRRVGPDGMPLGTAALVAASDFASGTDIAYNERSGEHLVAWEDEVARRVRGRIIDRAGAPQGPTTDLSPQLVDDLPDTFVGPAEPAATYNSATNEYLIAYLDRSPATDPVHVFTQRASAAASPLGTALRVSDLGPGGSISSQHAAVGYDARTGGYVVAWHSIGPGIDDPSQIFVQRLDRNGAESAGDVNLSSVPPLGDISRNPALSFNSQTGESLVSWSADSTTGDGIENPGLRIWARRLAGRPAPTPAEANCAVVPTPPAAGAPGELSLTAGQLRINQRIGQAAVRRANAIQKWLDDGLVSNDLCGGSLTAQKLDAGVATLAGIQDPPPVAAPRPVEVPDATPNPEAQFELSAQQLQINQRVYSAAVRRANALKERIEGSLTGGDIVDGRLDRDRLTQNLILGLRTPQATPTPASTTEVADPTPGNAVFTPTLKQLRINQKIAQAAVRRTNELRATLAVGLKAENFVDKSVSAVDFAP